MNDNTAYNITETSKTELSDELLCRLAAQKDTQAEELLVLRYRRFARAAGSAARGGRIRYPPPGRAAGMVPVCSRQRRRGTWIIRFFLVLHTAGGRHAVCSVWTVRNVS